MSDRKCDNPAELAGLAFERLAREGMPPTPENYSIWYNYYGGHLPDLNNAIDLMVSLGRPFTRTRCEDLYMRFLSYGENAQLIRETGEKTEAAISDVLDQLGQAKTETENFVHDVTGLRDHVLETLTIERLRAVIGEVSAGSKSVLKLQNHLLDKLADVTRELGRLRHQLHIAGLESRIDTLTGIANTKGFDEALANAIENAVQELQPLSLLAIDLDHLKRFNDQHGPLVGDQVLKLLAQLILRSIKGRDTLARLGGGKFSAILPHTNLANAAKLAEQLRRIIAASEISNRSRSENYGNVTISIGAGEYRLGEPAPILIDRVDQALATAKKGGRNRVTIETRPDEVAAAAAAPPA